MTSPRTHLAQAGIGWDPAFGAVIPPLYMSSTYVWPEPDVASKGPYDYGRTNNPNRDLLAEALNTLDGGAGAVVTSSGMAAIDLVLNLLPIGARVVAPYDCYGGTHRLLSARDKKGQIEVVFVDMADIHNVHCAAIPETSLILIESPSNPLMRLSDISRICDYARKRDIISVVDNTFLSPMRQKPIALGADIALQSTTKYLNGHSDVVGGVVVARTEELAEQLAWWANAAGLTGSPFDCYQTLRGLRTLPLRMDAAEKNAIALVAFLRDHPKVSDVYYPDDGLARQQQSGPGAMLSVRIKGNGSALLDNLNIFQLAASLGGTESLICQPATMTHRGMSEEARLAAGVDEGLLRLSVGIEETDDLLNAFAAALASI